MQRFFHDLKPHLINYSDATVKFFSEFSYLLKRGSSEWTPASIPGLINLSYAGSGALKTGGSPAANGEAVETWTRTSGTANLTQLTGASQPIYNTGIINGQPVLTFDGTDDFMSHSCSITGTTASWAAVFRSVTASGADRGAVLWDGSSNDWNSTTTGIFLLQNTATNWRTSRANADRVTYTVGASPANFIIISIYDGTNSVVWVNGVKQTPAACTGTFGATTFYLGAGYSGGVGFYTNFQVAATGLWSTGLSDEQAQTLSAYWNAIYAVY